MKKFLAFIEEYWTLIAAAVLATFIMCGCKGTKSLPVAHDTIYINNVEYVHDLRIDSIYIDRTHSVIVAGDTVKIVDSVLVYKERLTKDTIIVHDSTYKSKDEPVEVIKYKAPAWCKVIVLSLFLMVCLIFAYAYMTEKKAKK